MADVNFGNVLTAINEAKQPAGGYVLQIRVAAPTASAKGYSKGCLWVDLLNGALYQNTGTKTTATWTAIS